MVTKFVPNPTTEKMFAEAMKSWVMVVLTFVFILLYGAALMGRLKPLSDISMVTRLEPIIFVIIGYYFGRLPAQQNEKTLKEEVARQSQKADAAQHAKEQALQSREAIEEKMKNVRTALSAGGGSPSDKLQRPGNEEAVRHAVSAATKILNS